MSAWMAPTEPESEREVADAGAAAPVWTIPPRWCRLGIPFAVVLLTLMTFMPALLADFSYWDDDDLLFGVVQYRTLSLDSLEWMWTTSYAGHFHPLTWLSYTLDYSWSHRDAFGYHLTNVVLHLANTVVFYLVSLQLLRIGAKGASRSNAVYLGAGVSALLFAIHPLRAESVVWIAERRDVLSGLFYLLSILCYVRFASVPARRGRGDESRGARATGGIFYYTAAWFCMLLSLLAKASGVMLPLIFLVLDAYPLGRFTPHVGGRWRRVARAILEKLPFFVLALVVGVRALHAQEIGGALYALSTHDAAARAAQSVYGLAFYIWKFLCPIGLGPLYPIPGREVLLGPMLRASLLTVLLVFGAAWLTRRRYPMVLAVLVAYAVQLFPVVGVFQSGPQLVADRYSYLACLGFAMMGGAGAAVWHRCRKGAVVQARAGGTLLIVAVLGACSHLTFRQCGFWDTPVALWARGVSVSPDSAVARVNYADALAESGDPLAAIRSYDQALRLEATDPIAASHFGRVLARVGDFARAAKMFELSVGLDPDRSRDYGRLAEALIDQGRPAEAVTVLTARAQRAPHDLAAVDMLAALQSTHQDESIRDGAEAVRWATHVHRARGGNHPGAMLTLSTALAEAGDFDGAVRVGAAAVVIAMKGGDPRLLAELQLRLVMFREGRAYHYGE